MAIPKQVQQRKEAIERMYQAEAQPAEQPEAPQSDDAQQDDSEQAAENSNENRVEEAQASQDDPAADEPVEIQHPDQVAKELADLRKQGEQSEQRFKTLQGMMQRTEQENQRLQMLLAQMAEADKKVESDKPAAKADDPGEAKDKADFGEDFIDMVNRAIDRRLSKLEERLGKTEGMAERSYKSAEKSEQARFEAELDQKAEGWRAIDTSSEFLEWLNSSPTRLAIVREGMANYDSTAIAEIFELYKQLTGKGQEATSAPAGKKLEKKVAPSKGRTSTPSGSEEKKQWTKTEIAQVFRDRRRYNPKEFEKLQKDIFKAQQEERVDYTR